MPILLFNDKNVGLSFSISQEDMDQIPVVMELIESFKTCQLSNEDFDDLCKELYPIRLITVRLISARWSPNRW